MPWPPNSVLRDLATKMEGFEAAKSQENTGAGARREGSEFELLARAWWDAVVAHLSQANGVAAQRFADERGKVWTRLERTGRVVIVRTLALEPAPARVKQRWLERKFLVEELIAGYPGAQEAVGRYAPDSGLFAGEFYPRMYAGLTTEFDDTIVLEENGVLRNKILLEYKTAKRVAKNPTMLEGNAHERLSFQMMQYLEIATRYTKCTFWVLVNGAFSRLRNKYHVNFHVQSDRMRNFSWFEMKHSSTAEGYLALYSQC